MVPEGSTSQVRLGTVLAATSDAFLTDCRINGGDSGGPYFDLDGRVIGILKVCVPLLDEPAQEGKAVFQHNRVMPRGGLWWRGNPSTLIRTRLARMERGEILTTPEPAQAGAPARGPILVRDLLAEDRRTQGKAMLGRFRRAVTDASRSALKSSTGARPPRSGPWSTPTAWSSRKRARCRTEPDAACQAGGSLRPR